MKFYGIDSKGLIKIQEVESLPTWSSDYERSIIYNKQDQILYYGNSTGWSRVIDHIHTNKTVLDDITTENIELLNSITTVDTTVINNLTQDVIDNSHIHTNKILLDNLELVDGKLNYGGEVISGGVLTVDDKYIFNTIAERDAYFSAHPSELVEDLYVVITDETIFDGGGTTEITASYSRMNYTQDLSPVNILSSYCDGFKIFTNTGSTGEVILNLPPGSDGLRFMAIVTASYDFCFKAYPSNTIRSLDTISISGGTIKSGSIGDVLQMDWNGTQWTANISGKSWFLEVS